MSWIHRRHLVASALALLAALHPAAAQRYDTVVERILAAWETADVVCLGEDHARYYDSELRIALVRHPAFPRTVRVIVIESANPVHQDLLDRFVLDGNVMSREDLAPIWRDASGAEVWESPIYEQFLRAVRDVNLALPKAQRVRILGGDSKIDWARITSAEELAPLMNRGGNIRNIIVQQILEPHIKGLAIYGAGHCSKIGGGFPGDLYGKYAEGRMWSIWPFVEAAGARRGRAVFGLDARPAYVVVTGTKWASTAARERLMIVESGFSMADVLDAVVYHGDVRDSVVRADLAVLNAKYGAEFKRRGKLMDEAFKLQQRRRSTP